MGLEGELGGLVVGGNTTPRTVVVIVTATLCEMAASSVTEPGDGVQVAAVGAPEQLMVIA